MINSTDRDKTDNFNFTPHSNVSDIIRETVDSFRALSKDIELEVKVLSATNHLFTKLHPRDIQSIVANIITNGVEAIEERNTPNGKVIVTIKRNNSTISIKVWNNGIAIDPVVKDHIFNYKFTTKDHHSGIGLFKVVQILKFASSSITLLHSDNDYTEFEILISAI